MDYRAGAGAGPKWNGSTTLLVTLSLKADTTEYIHNTYYIYDISYVFICFMWRFGSYLGQCVGVAPKTNNMDNMLLLIISDLLLYM